MSSEPCVLLCLAIVLSSAAIVLTTPYVSRADPRPKSGHLWKKHILPRARASFYTRSQVNTRIRRLRRALPTPTPSVTDEQDQDSTTEVFFPWVKEGGLAQNWVMGLGFGALGLLGALVTIYLFLGESLPSMGGKAEYESLRLELEDFKDRRDKTLRAREKFARGETDDTPADQLRAQDELSADYNATITRLESQLARERWRLYLMGFPVYLVLGAAFAVLFASNALQAILVGFGWTALADRIGLKRELEVKREKKDRQIQELEEVASEQTKRAQNLAKSSADLKARLNAGSNENEVLKQVNGTLIRQLALVGSQRADKVHDKNSQT